jgi:hypothetical protein
MPEEEVSMSEGIIRIVVGLVALLIGWGIGFFDSKLRADKKISQTEEKAQLVIQQAKGEAERAVMLARAAAESTPPALPGKTLLRLWLDSAERPALDMDGQTVDTAPLAEPNRKRLIVLLNAMRPWIEGKIAAPSVAPTPALLPATPPAPPAPSPIRGSSVVPVSSVMPAPKAEKPAAPLSIVGQIDEILQARLAASPMAGRAIRLQESPEGGVIVWVGLQKFAGVNEVTDPEVQAIIRAATLEWEKKYTPGL